MAGGGGGGRLHQATSLYRQFSIMVLLIVFKILTTRTMSKIAEQCEEKPRKSSEQVNH